MGVCVCDPPRVGSRHVYHVLDVLFIIIIFFYPYIRVSFIFFLLAFFFLFLFDENLPPPSTTNHPARPSPSIVSCEHIKR